MDPHDAIREPGPRGREKKALNLRRIHSVPWRCAHVVGIESAPWHIHVRVAVKVHDGVLVVDAERRAQRGT